MNTFSSSEKELQGSSLNIHNLPSILADFENDMSNLNRSLGKRLEDIENVLHTAELNLAYVEEFLRLNKLSQLSQLNMDVNKDVTSLTASVTH